MKNKLTLIIAFFTFAAIFCAFPAKADEDQFSSEILHHGIPFDHYDFFAEAHTCSPTNPCDPVPLTHFEPGYLRLTKLNAGIEINGHPVIVQPQDVPTIPVATAENQVEVLNQIRDAMIAAKLANAPE